MRASLYPFGSRLRLPSQTKLKCAQIVPQCYLPGVNSTSNWAKLWSDFNWVGWIKPQIDLAIASGFNAVKITINCFGLNETGSNGSGGAGGDAWPSQSALLSKFNSFLAYCTLNNLLVYVNLFAGGNELFGITDGTYPARLAAAVQIAQWCETIPGSPVVLIDMCNEVQFNGPSNWGASSQQIASDLSGLAGAIRTVTRIPLTASVYLNTAGDWTGAYMQYLAPIVDVLDGHAYYGIQGGSPSSIPALSDVSTLMTKTWAKPFILGENGVNQAVAAGTQTSYLNGLGALASHPQCWGAVLFAMADYDITDGAVQQWGAADYNVQNPRSLVLTAVQSWPGRIH